MSVRFSVPVLSLLAVGALSGCGSGSSTATNAAVVPASPAAPSQGSATVSPAEAVAFISGTPISKASYRHWLAIETGFHAAGSPAHQALGFLITSEWVLGEAAARHISVSDAEVKQHFAKLVRQSFPKPGSLQKQLDKWGETEADLLARIKVELLAAKIAAKVTVGKSASQRSALLGSFESNFHSHWKSFTDCKPGYVMEDCKQYHGKPENLTAKSSSSSTSSTSTSHSSVNSASSRRNEVYNRPGAFSISSPAFERNGTIPVKYTCAGAGTSPPLSWEKIPAKAAELILFVIDENPRIPDGGIRWVVGGISPSSTGVAAGQLPSGAIVGTNTAGKAAYTAICPPHGKSDTVEFIVYALKKTIALSPGFQPSTAEAEYGASKDLMSEPAITYGVASR